MEEQAGSVQGSAAGGGAGGLRQAFALWHLNSRRLFHSAKSGTLESGSSFCPKEASGRCKEAAPFLGTTWCSRGK